MKKLSSAKRLLLSTERVRDLLPDQMRFARGGLSGTDGGGDTIADPPPDPTGGGAGCPVANSKIRCLNSNPA